MAHRGKKISNFIKMSLALVSVIGTTVLSNVTVAKAEEIIHTHIWATKYDESKHWEYCTVCAKTRNGSEHKFEDHWREGKETCWHHNYSTRVCECGYSYKYYKPHTTIHDWKHYNNRILHYKSCESCGTWKGSEACSNANGKLSCKNPGTCSTCGGVTTKDNHYIVKGGTCRDCGIKLLDISEPIIKYAADYSMATVTFTMKPVAAGVSLTGKMVAYVPEKNSKSATWKSTSNADGSYTYTLEHVFNENVQRKSTYYCVDQYSAAKFNGTPTYIDQKTIVFSLVQDKTAPTVTEVAQKDQKISNGWATIKELTITGTEDLSDIVTISIKDKQTGDVIVDKAVADVKDGKYTYKCTPPLEGPAEGRSYIVTVVDQVDHSVDKEFIIYKTDCRAPLIRSSKEYIEWSKTKNLELELTDYGSGSPESSMGNQTSYIATKFVDGKYFACYSFAEDKYDVSEYKLYLRDGLGNATVETIKVGKVDNTKPTITEVKGEVKEMEMYITAKDSETGEVAPAPTAPTTPSKYASITVTANDMNKKLNKEGSGVAGYALTTSIDRPNNEQWQTINTVEATKPGTYYLWVKDTAGNIADLKVITVKDNFTIEIGDKDIVVDNPEGGKYEAPGTAIEPVKDNSKDKNKVDKTPKTADTTLIYSAGALLIASAIIMVVIKCKKTRRY